ncbi:unnamed protein product [Ixodes pacificus]
MRVTTAERRLAYPSSSSSSGTKMSFSSRKAAPCLLMVAPTYRPGSTARMALTTPRLFVSGSGHRAPELEHTLPRADCRLGRERLSFDAFFSCVTGEDSLRRTVAIFVRVRQDEWINK